MNRARLFDLLGVRVYKATPEERREATLRGENAAGYYFVFSNGFNYWSEKGSVYDLIKVIIRHLQSPLRAEV